MNTVTQINRDNKNKYVCILYYDAFSKKKGTNYQGNKCSMKSVGNQK